MLNQRHIEIVETAFGKDNAKMMLSMGVIPVSFHSVNILCEFVYSNKNRPEAMRKLCATLNEMPRDVQAICHEEDLTLIDPFSLKRLMELYDVAEHEKDMFGLSGILALAVRNRVRNALRTAA